MVSNESYLPSFKELKVPVEMNLTTPYLRAGARHMYAACEPKCHELMLCRQEEEDPRKCLGEGKAVTACGVDFLQNVKKSCRPEFDGLGSCIEYRGTGRFLATRCKAEQRLFDTCMWEKMGLERPPDGAISKPHLHSTARPLPSKGRDYQAEADALRVELPPDSSINRDSYANFKTYAAFDWFAEM